MYGFNSTLGIQKVRTESTVLTSSCPAWLALAYELRTASPNYDERELGKIKEVLAIA